ncbi:hypothetical protein [Streptomyces sp. NPDC007205]|uniref:hypothetical protein n=1 Tax=Streptomyces sp. NPDC007205 TaxID=3154316 RepID=UPI0033D32D9E
MNHTLEQLAVQAPSLTEALTSHHADGYVLLDRTLAETDWVAAAGHFFGKSPPSGRECAGHRRRRRKAAVDLAHPARRHPHMTAAREHAIANTCAQLNLKILADNAHVGAGGTAITPIKRRPNAQLEPFRV